MSVREIRLAPEKMLTSQVSLGKFDEKGKRAQEVNEGWRSWTLR